ncbi:Glucan-binding domain-containing protein (YG repeat) [Ruminococcaceae bacterium YRB3002]|nr:Glucan-binding domain-containing protein (YG repeat) [Ruminococcaceae bacterium YRB3002]
MRMRERILSGVLASVIAISALPFLHADVSAGGFKTARETVDAIGAGWNLGNTLDSYGSWISSSGGAAAYETAWGNPKTTKAMIDSVKAQGFNAIRIPVTWAQHIDSNGNVDSSWMARVREVVNYCYNDGLYVILNVHHDTGETGGDKVSWIKADNSVYSSTKAKFAGLWKSIANEFKDYGDHLLFEGYNEMLDKNNSWNTPSSSASYSAVNSYAQLFVDTVRSTGGNNANRNLIVNTYVASIYQAALDNFAIPSDSVSGHLICEVHCYDPWAFTGTSSTVTWTSVHKNFSSSDKSEIDTIMKRLKSFSDNRGVPVIIGEYGAEYKGNDDQIALYASYFIKAAGSRGIKCFLWDNGKYKTSGEGEYCIFNRSSLKWKTGISSAIVNAAAPYSTESAEAPEPPEPMVNGGWNSDANGWFYIKGGSKIVSSWEKIGGVWYYFGEDGYMATGLTSIKGSLFFFNPSGSLFTGWKKINGEYYYFTSNGAVVSAWRKISGVWYYFDENGVMATGIQEIKGVNYWFASSGALKTGWLLVDGSYMYFTSNGAVTSAWKQISRKWYYFDENGIMLTGYQDVGGINYLFASSGAMLTGWQKVDGQWHYFAGSGAEYRSAWLKSGGKWYYLGEDGVMVTSDTIEIGGTRYTFNGSGIWVA